MPDTPQVFRVRELELRYKPHRLDAPFPDRVNDPATAARLAAHVLRDAATEVVLVLHLNARHKVIGMQRICGSTGSVPISLAELLRASLLSNATSVVFAHNHVSGEPQPSPEDREIVQRLRNALRLLSLELLDAVIVIDPAEGSAYYSFREQGLI